MKNAILFVIIAAASLLGIGCKKTADTLPNPQLSSITIINAVLDAGPVKFNHYKTGLSYEDLSDSINYGSSLEYPIISGNQPLAVVLSRDTSTILYHNTYDFTPFKSYSMYTAGILPNTKNFFFEDNIPVHKDSTVGVRFINLSMDSKPVSINVQGSSQSDFSNVAYGQISQFKSYPADMNSNPNQNYTFEVRDLSSGVLLTTFTWYFSVFKNNTLVISGLVNASNYNAITVFQVNNY
jgi:hypothetical protein